MVRNCFWIRPQAAMAKRQFCSARDDDVLFKVHANKKAVITLNRPKALNSLNASMAESIFTTLRQWESQRITLVMIEGEGDKAFCAGGDIRAITASSTPTAAQAKFFSQEYQLNHLIGSLSIPYVAFIHGITMGGGVGLSVHGQFRVATEKTVFAMPEVSIGLFPDVGGSYFLPKLHAELGTFLALTGYRLKSADCIHAGIATHGCRQEDLECLKNDLLNLPEHATSSDVESVLDHYSTKFPKKDFSLAPMMPLINRTFALKSVEEIVDGLSQAQSAWATDLAATMLKMSPTSMKVSLRQLREGKKLASLKQCLQMEYRIVKRFCARPDFFEGVRAVLVDRDNEPKWNPDSLDGVTDEMVDEFFAPLPQEEELILA